MRLAIRMLLELLCNRRDVFYASERKIKFTSIRNVEEIRKQLTIQHFFSAFIL